MPLASTVRSVVVRARRRGHVDLAAKARRAARARARSRSAGARRDRAGARSCERRARDGPHDGPPANPRCRPRASTRRPAGRSRARATAAPHVDPLGPLKSSVVGSTSGSTNVEYVLPATNASASLHVQSPQRQLRLAVEIEREQVHLRGRVIVPSAVGVSESQLTCDCRTESRRSESAGPNGVAETRNVSCSGPVCLLRVASPSSSHESADEISRVGAGKGPHVRLEPLRELRVRAAADDGRPVVGGSAAGAANAAIDIASAAANPAQRSRFAPSPRRRDDATMSIVGGVIGPSGISSIAMRRLRWKDACFRSCRRPCWRLALTVGTTAAAQTGERKSAVASSSRSRKSQMPTNHHRGLGAVVGGLGGSRHRQPDRRRHGARRRHGPGHARRRGDRQQDPEEVRPAGTGTADHRARDERRARHGDTAHQFQPCAPGSRCTSKATATARASFRDRRRRDPRRSRWRRFGRHHRKDKAPIAARPCRGLVETRRIELPTSALRTRRSPS